MSNIDEIQQVIDIIVELLPAIKRDKAKNLANLIVNRPDMYPDSSFTFDECAAFVVAKHTYNDLVKK